MRSNFLVLGVILILGAVAVSGCTSQSSNTITIQNSSFNPSMLTITAGTTVTWVNKANGTMDVTSDSGLFSSGNITNGQSFNYTFNDTGTFPYHSSINPSMTGQILVSNTTGSSNSNSNGSSGSPAGY
jgi:plastocyanin